MCPSPNQIILDNGITTGIRDQAPTKSTKSAQSELFSAPALMSVFEGKAAIESNGLAGTDL
jgi:hypothetical protein